MSRAIESGELAGGDMLPSSRVLAEHLDISRNTVNRAYRELAVDGFVEPIDRVGYVVNEGLGEPDTGGREQDRPDAGAPVRWDELLSTPADGPGEPTRPAGWRSYPYPFVVGPGPESFPIGSWTRAMRTALRKEHRGTSLHNLDDQDDPLLVEQIRTTILPGRGDTSRSRPGAGHPRYPARAASSRGGAARAGGRGGCGGPRLSRRPEHLRQAGGEDGGPTGGRARRAHTRRDIGA